MRAENVVRQLRNRPSSDKIDETLVEKSETVVESDCETPHCVAFLTADELRDLDADPVLNRRDYWEVTVSRPELEDSSPTAQNPHERLDLERNEGITTMPKELPGGARHGGGGKFVLEVALDGNYIANEGKNLGAIAVVGTV